MARIAFQKDMGIYIPKSNPNIGILDYFLGDSFSFAEPGDLTQILNRFLYPLLKSISKPNKEYSECKWYFERKEP